MTRRPKTTKALRVTRRSPRKTAAKVKRDPLDDFIATGARALDLAIDPSWMAAVRMNLHVTLMLGARVAQFALPDDIEPAPVFEA